MSDGMGSERWRFQRPLRADREPRRMVVPLRAMVTESAVNVAIHP